MGRKYDCQGRMEAATASNILICDYFVSRGKLSERIFKANIITVVSIVCGKHSHDQ